MKLLRIAELVLFLLSAAAFTGYKIYEKTSIDTTGPVITCKSDNITESVKTTKEGLLKDVSAYDQIDGDVTKSLIIEKLSNITGDGKRTITYAAFDSSNNVTKYQRELSYTDYTPPRFSLIKPLIFPVGDYDKVADYISVSDCIDGDLTENIRYEQPDMYFGESEGSYQIKYIVTNSSGVTATLPVLVDFINPNYEKGKPPEISLSDYLVYIKNGSTFDPYSYLKSVTIDDRQYYVIDSSQKEIVGNTISRNMITVQSNVDLKVPGTYEVKYTLTSKDGSLGYTKLVVVVEE